MPQRSVEEWEARARELWTTGVRSLGPNERGAEAFERLADGQTIVRIPGGNAELGVPERFRAEVPPWAIKTSCPPHRTHVPPDAAMPDDVILREAYAARSVELGAFAIDETEVTWAQYARFQAVTHRVRPHRPKWAGDDHPVTRVTWHEAAAYCDAVGGRLPSDAEWERAARGLEGHAFPWGDEWPPPLLSGNYYDASLTAAFCDPVVPDLQDDGFVFTAPAGSFPAGASPFGVLDLLGNASEWVGDWHDEVDDTSRRSPRAARRRRARACGRRSSAATLGSTATSCARRRSARGSGAARIRAPARTRAASAAPTTRRRAHRAARRRGYRPGICRLRERGRHGSSRIVLDPEARPRPACSTPAVTSSRTVTERSPSGQDDSCETGLRNDETPVSGGQPAVRMRCSPKSEVLDEGSLRPITGEVHDAAWNLFRVLCPGRVLRWQRQCRDRDRFVSVQWSGVTGTLDDGSVEVSFQSCTEITSSSVEQFRYEAWTVGGPIVELLYVPSTEVATAWIAGIELGGTLSQGQREDIVEAVSSDEGLLLTELFTELRALGFDQGSGKMAVIGGGSLLLPEDIHLDGKCDQYPERCAYCAGGFPPGHQCGRDGHDVDKCLGCCGAGCAGCLGICTDACLAHDCCTRTEGFFSCFGSFFEAIGSVISHLFSP